MQEGFKIYNRVLKINLKKQKRLESTNLKIEELEGRVKQLEESVKILEEKATAQEEATAIFSEQKMMKTPLIQKKMSL